jgi:flagellar export protein FliJ
MYRFKLEALLTHRRRQEEAGQKELAQARRKLFDERQKLDRKKREKQEILEALQAEKNKRTTASDIRLYMNYIQQLSKEIEDQARQMHRSAKFVDQKRQELVAIMKKHNTLKKLKYKGQRTYQQKMMQTERKLMDDFASIRHVRKMQS